MKTYTQEQRERRCEYSRLWREKNPESVRENNRRWREENPKSVRENNRRWREENPSYHWVWGKQKPAAGKLSSYRHWDKKKGHICDLTLGIVETLVLAPCEYCKTTEDTRGLDRLDNKRGHCIDNVVPCCAWCNVARNHHFTPDEMREFIGPSIAAARHKRKTKET